jgi:hypothetical protein
MYPELAEEQVEIVSSRIKEFAGEKEALDIP